MALIRRLKLLILIIIAIPIYIKAQPVNDECSGAVNIVVQSTCSFSGPYTTIGATKSSSPACAGTAEDDTWFKFTATNTRQRIWISSGSTFNPVIEVFTGSCGNLTSLGCFYSPYDNPSGGRADLNNVSVGTTYYFRVYDKAANSPTTDIRVCIIPLPSPPSNDECSGAISLSVNNNNTCTNTLTGAQEYATQSKSSCIATGYQALDVWYKFVATSTSHKITINPLDYRDLMFEAFSGNCGSLTSIGCVNNGAPGQQDILSLNNLTIGATYYLRVFDGYENTSDSRFTICINTASITPINDECSGAIDIVSQSICSFSAPYNTIGATKSSSPACVGTAEDDTWFKFTATNTRQRIWISSGSIDYPVIEVFTGSCGNLTSLGCFYNDSYADLNKVSVGTTYYFRVYDKAANSPATDIRVCIIPLPSPPPNDECSEAISLSVNNNNTCTNSLTGAQEYATQSMNSCIATGRPALDVWYKFVATSTRHKITINPLNYRDIIFEVFSGNCGSLTSIGCVNNGASGQQDILSLNNLTIGATYYLRVFDGYANTSESQFTICINTASNTPINDECSGAVDIASQSICSFSAPYTTIGATKSSSPACVGTAEDDTWFKFTATNTRQRIWISSGSTFNPVIEVFTGSCGNLTSLGCFYSPYDNPSGGRADLNNVSVGTTYYFRVYDKAANSPATDIRVCIIPLPPPPSNDECSGAISLSVNNNNTCTNTLTGAQEYATQSMSSCIAMGYQALDVWYKFVATSTRHKITISPLNYRDLMLEAFSGNCGSLTSIGCVNNGAPGQQEVLSLNNLTIGATYYLRVFDGNENTSDSRFTICINTDQSAATSAIIVASSLNPSTFEQTVTFTATVTATSGTPTGTVSFYDGTTLLGTGTLSGYKATLTTTTLSVGTHNITTSYGGNVGYTASRSPVLAHVVNTRSSATSLVIYPNPVTDNFINLKMANMPQGSYSIRLLNNFGLPVFTVQLNNLSGNSTERILLGEQIKGAYFLEIIKPDNSKVTSNVFIY